VVGCGDDALKRLARKATRKQTRAHNSRLVLRTIYDGGRISRADIARATGLTRTTVSDVVADLIEKNLVEEVGLGPSAGGKPPMLLSVVDDSHHLIGIDLASSEFRGAVVNLWGEIRHQMNLPLDDRDGEEALALVYDLVDRLIAATDCSLLGIGIGTPGLMDPVHGVVRRAVNLDWRDLPLRKLLQQRFDLPVHVANDCQVAALAEYAFGEGKNSENLVVVKIEHGVGAGIVLNGHLYHGDTYGAGEIGHVTVVEHGLQCRCGNVGCLETVLSTRAILQQALKIAQNDPQTAHNPREITMQTVCLAVEAGDEPLLQLVKATGRYLGMALANLVAVLSVGQIILAGSITCLGQTLLDAVRQEMVGRSLSGVASQTEISMSSMGPDIVILGASALVMTRELGLFAPLRQG
jgi:glucokinase-like ROK family protein